MDVLGLLWYVFYFLFSFLFYFLFSFFVLRFLFFGEGNWDEREGGRG